MHPKTLYFLPLTLLIFCVLLYYDGFASSPGLHDCLTRCAERATMRAAQKKEMAKIQTPGKLSAMWLCCKTNAWVFKHFFLIFFIVHVLYRNTWQMVSLITRWGMWCNRKAMRSHTLFNSKRNRLGSHSWKQALILRGHCGRYWCSKEAWKDHIVSLRYLSAASTVPVFVIPLSPV